MFKETTKKILTVITLLAVMIGSFYLNYKFIGGNNFLDLFLLVVGSVSILTALQY